MVLVVGEINDTNKKLVYDYSPLCWIDLQDGQIIRCSQVFKWAVHLNYEVLVDWLKSKGNVRLERLC